MPGGGPFPLQSCPVTGIYGERDDSRDRLARRQDPKHTPLSGPCPAPYGIFTATTRGRAKPPLRDCEDGDSHGQPVGYAALGAAVTSSAHVSVGKDDGFVPVGASGPCVGGSQQHED